MIYKHNSGAAESPSTIRQNAADKVLRGIDAQRAQDERERIVLSMAEERQKHRQRVEYLLAEGLVKEVARGQVFAFLLSLVGLIGGGSLVFLGHGGLYGAIFGGSLVGLASVFITGRHPRKEDKKE